MSANLGETNGRAAMMYVGETPWHGLGTKLEKAATAAEALTAAGLDWKVEKKPIFLADGKRVDGHYATVREDTGTALGVVGEVYRPLQNKEALSLMDGIVGVKEAMYHTAGALGNGSRVWLLAKMPGYIRVIGDDITEKYLLLTNTHDGTTTADVMLTPVRVVCQNTLNAALGNNSGRQKMRHTKSLGLRVKDVREGLGIINSMFSEFEQAAKALTEVQVNSEAWKAFIQKIGLMPEGDAAQQAMSTRAKNIMEEVTKLFENGRGSNLKGVRGTAWGAYNSITEYVDHHRTVRAGDDARERLEARASSLLFGSGALLKEKAWNAALELAGAGK